MYGFCDEVSVSADLMDFPFCGPPPNQSYTITVLGRIRGQQMLTSDTMVRVITGREQMGISVKMRNLEIGLIMV